MSVWKTLSLILSGLLILPLALAGCSSTEVSAREIANNVILAYPEVDTYRMDMDFTMTMIVDADTAQMQVDVTGNATGTVNAPAREMQYTMDMTADIPEQGEQSITQDVYISGGYLYMNTSGAGADGWNKMELSDELWESEDQLKQQVEFLEKALDITYAGEETVDGVDCYILKIKPDMAALFDWVMSQQQDLFSGVDTSQFNLAKMFKQFSIKEWVTKDNSLPVKSEIQMTMEISPQDMGAGVDETGKITLVMQAEAKYHNYNEPVTIKVPQEALNAPLVPLY